MAPVAYTVIATLPDEATRREYISWLEGGHVAAVLRAGAASGAIVVVEDPATPLRVETRYQFATRESLDSYLRTSAPALREEGLRRFGPGTGVRMERQIGRVVG